MPASTPSRRTAIFRRVLRYILWTVIAIPILFFALSFVPLRETISPMSPRPDTRYWSLDRGERIAYTLIDGDPGDAHSPVIFLHGGPGGYIHSSIVTQTGRLAAAGFDIYLYDQIGSGLSDRLDRPKDYSFARHVSDLAEIVRTRVGGRKVILIGQSFGACLAAHYAAVHPETVDRIIFTSPGSLEPTLTNTDGTLVDLNSLYPAPESLTFTDPIRTTEELDLMLLKPRILMTVFCAMIFNAKWASDREIDGLINTMATHFTRGMVCDSSNVLPEEGGGGGYAYMFSNWYEGIDDPRETIRALSIPVLVLQGQCDQAPYSQAYEYAALFRGKYEYIRNAGHEIWWEQPDTFIDIIRSFVTESLPRADSTGT